jgi:hypothetical protein
MFGPAIVRVIARGAMIAAVSGLLAATAVAALAAEFKRKLSDDPEFAKSPAARLEFFARRHPSWDERFNLYPVMRFAVTPK